ncbi:hypothetical protein JCM19275_3283 [Nonlabens ulvanivorans]|uniref:DUF1735 domain-containing protein n=2 Tax=Flavobacteriaceae TaxID=49546 RepID=A0A090QC50_NONUL|nr:hypothetical protein JCM19314_1702 [Nonlabens ulvanivorans]GAL74428.1 hypothetical protein JCM19275_3283 [Nonlabens ulvanivorans]
MMKNIKILGLAALAIFAVSCEEERSDNYFNGGETAIQFNNSASNPLAVAPDVTLDFEVKVGISETADVDRTVNISVDPSSTYTDYTLGNVVIPAGSYEGTAILTTNPEMNFSGPETLVLNLDGVEGTYPDGEPIQFTNRTQQLSFSTFAFCPFDDGVTFTGDYVINHLNTNAFGIPTFGAMKAVELRVGANPSIRTFAAPWGPDLGDFSTITWEMALICDEVVWTDGQDALVGCAATPANIELGSPDAFAGNGSFDGSDDATFIANFTDDSLGDCGPPTQVSIQLVKQ